MKFFKWKYFIITGIVCLLPIFIGVALWDKLPDKIAIHFDINNNPDNYGNKGFVVFGLPFLMVILQSISCLIYDINAKKYGERKKFESVIKWIIPVMSVLLQLVTFGVALGKNIDIRICVALIVGGIFIIIGNYLPKLDYVKNYDLDTDKARKINRFVGIGSVIMGALFIASVFLPPISTIVCIFALIPYAVICAIYGFKVAGKK